MLLKENFYKRRNEKSWSLWLLPLAFLSCFIFSTQSFAMTIEKDSEAKTVQDKGVTPESRKVPSLGQYLENLFESLRDENFVIDKAEINDVIKILKAENKPLLWKEWFSLKISNQYPEVVKDLIEKEYDRALEWGKSPYKLLGNGPYLLNSMRIIGYALINGGHRPTLSYSSVSKIRLIGLIYSKGYALANGGYGPTLPSPYLYVEKEKIHWRSHFQIVNILIESGDQTMLRWIVDNALRQPKGKKHAEFIEAIIERGNQRTLKVVDRMLSEEAGWKNHPRLLELTQGKEVNAENLKKALVEVNKNQKSCS